VKKENRTEMAAEDKKVRRALNAEAPRSVRGHRASMRSSTSVHIAGVKLGILRFEQISSPVHGIHDLKIGSPHLGLGRLKESYTGSISNQNLKLGSGVASHQPGARLPACDPNMPKVVLSSNSR
jgi:hypothetical protein